LLKAAIRFGANLPSQQLLAQAEKSCGDKALIHVASPVGGLYQGVVFGWSRRNPGERNGE
jgi:hypothetical protein